MLLIIDFGSQTTHLIGRRFKDLGAHSTIVTPEAALETIVKEKPSGIVLAGGPMSVYEDGAPSLDPKIFELGIPILGICYGFQLTAHLLGGEVVSGRKEYGPAKFSVLDENAVLLKGVAKESTVWMNHGDEIVKLPEDFVLIGQTKNVPFTCTMSTKRKIYGILFHPEVEHTQFGNQIFQNFLEICDVKKEHHGVSPEDMIKKIQETVGSAHVIGAVSGGVDSTVAATLVAKAIGKRFTPIFVNNGLMRDDAVDSVKNLFKRFDITPVVIEVEEQMLQKLKGITDSEEKRKVIGNFYIEIFEQEMTRLLQENADVQFLMQGTIYSDVIESQGSKHASKIKSHHNVGGLPENMKLKLLEPLRELYKDEVRALGKELGLPEEFVLKQPFPGPGFAVRIRGEVTKERLSQEKHADKIVMEELKNAGWLEKIFISFPVMTNASSTAIKGDGKFMGEVIALRVVESKDIMSSTWAHLPYDVLQTISSRIVNEVAGISRVVYDITTKPPATMEWE
ncbi:MAG TPA: glutamine-hydrolyzing GMP synthase [Patescibacteria group bacterium]|nr:glutamine-hydrolyzing GMP synthase [Patescibacteria group bacterium]